MKGFILTINFYRFQPPNITIKAMIAITPLMIVRRAALTGTPIATKTAGITERAITATITTIRTRIQKDEFNIKND